MSYLANVKMSYLLNVKMSYLAHVKMSYLAHVKCSYLAHVILKIICGHKIFVKIKKLNYHSFFVCYFLMIIRKIHIIYIKCIYGKYQVIPTLKLI